jgi:HTH-type transcriptional regulator / antitoxin HigA
VEAMVAAFNQEYGHLLTVVQPKVIETEEENEYYLAEVAKLMHLGEELSPAQEQLLRLLVNLIESFEDQHYQMHPATPLEILQEFISDSFACTSGDRGLKQKDLLPVFGSQGITSEVLNGRSISKAQSKALGEFFKVSPTLFFRLLILIKP